MKLQVYSIRDAKAEVYNLPFLKKTHGEAERDFHKLCNDTQSMVNRYPDDYDLYFIGSFDESTGVLKPLDTPQHIQKAAMVLNKATATPITQ